MYKQFHSSFLYQWFSPISLRTSDAKLFMTSKSLYNLPKTYNLISVFSLLPFSPVQRSVLETLERWPVFYLVLNEINVNRQYWRWRKTTIWTMQEWIYMLNVNFSIFSLHGIQQPKLREEKKQIDIFTPFNFWICF